MEHLRYLLLLVFVAACNNAPSVSSSQSANDNDTPPADRWSALAVGVEWIDQGTWTGNMYVGRAVSEATELSAKDAAIAACAFDTCEIKVYVDVGCIGLAHGFDPDDHEWTGFGAVQYAADSGATVAEAKRNTRHGAGEAGIEGCMGGTLDRQCQVKEAFCSWDTAGDSSSAGISQWITSMGGESADGVRTTLLYLARAAEPLLRNSGLTTEQARCVVGSNWARLTQVATSCSLSVDQLDDLYAKANLLNR